MKSLSVLSFVALIALAGCGNDNATPQPADAAPTSAAPAAADVASPIAAGAQLASSEPVSTEGAVSLNDDCNVEGVDGTLFTADELSISRQGTHEISGWVVDAKNRAIPAGLKLVVAGVGNTAGVWTNQAPTWIERKGVAETRGYGPELYNSGFSFKVDTSAIPAGAYHVYVMSSGANGLQVCDPGRQVTITE